MVPEATVALTLPFSRHMLCFVSHADAATIFAISAAGIVVLATCFTLGSVGFFAALAILAESAGCVIVRFVSFVSPSGAKVLVDISTATLVRPPLVPQGSVACSSMTVLVSLLLPFSGHGECLTSNAEAVFAISTEG